MLKLKSCNCWKNFLLLVLPHIGRGGNRSCPRKSPKEKYAIEIKRSLAPTVSKGFHLGCDDIGATKRFVIYPGKERFPTSYGVTVLPLVDMMDELRQMR